MRMRMCWCVEDQERETPNEVDDARESSTQATHKDKANHGRPINSRNYASTQHRERYEQKSAVLLPTVQG
jgi:hypothetical protein